ncbi:MAG: serine/threonine protein kinase [Coriobacteriales bacterium]|jgi:serine/threonine protein kinase|nr:serine/threonine protein kinase [Coriobacteriales bacterium]
MNEQLLLNRYRLQQRRGHGGFGVVDIAWDQRLRRRVAIKRIPLRVEASDLPGIEEARTAALLSNPHIVSVYDFEITGAEALIIMENVDGPSLAELMQKSQELFDFDALRAVLSGVVSALECAHENQVLHLDIKPANILIDHAGNIKMSDFGLSALSSTAGFTGPEGGTIGYMPPEQIAMEPVDERSDLWALAALTYHLLTGTNPFFAHTAQESYNQIVYEPVILPSVLCPDLDEGIDDVLMSALDADMDMRPRSVKAFWKKLSGYLGHEKRGQKELKTLVELWDTDGEGLGRDEAEFDVEFDENDNEADQNSEYGIVEYEGDYSDYNDHSEATYTNEYSNATFNDRRELGQGDFEQEARKHGLNWLFNRKPKQRAPRAKQTVNAQGFEYLTPSDYIEPDDFDPNDYFEMPEIDELDKQYHKHMKSKPREEQEYYEHYGRKTARRQAPLWERFSHRSQSVFLRLLAALGCGSMAWLGCSGLVAFGGPLEFSLTMRILITLAIAAGGFIAPVLGVAIASLVLGIGVIVAGHPVEGALILVGLTAWWVVSGRRSSLDATLMSCAPLAACLGLPFAIALLAGFFLKLKRALALSLTAGLLLTLLSVLAPALHLFPTSADFLAPELLRCGPELQIAATTATTATTATSATTAATAATAANTGLLSGLKAAFLSPEALVALVGWILATCLLSLACTRQSRVLWLLGSFLAILACAAGILVLPILTAPLVMNSTTNFLLLVGPIVSLTVSFVLVLIMVTTGFEAQPEAYNKQRARRTSAQKR